MFLWKGMRRIVCLGALDSLMSFKMIEPVYCITSEVGTKYIEKDHFQTREDVRMRMIRHGSWNSYLRVLSFKRLWWSSTNWERMVSWIRFFVKQALFPALKRPRTYRKGSRTKKISLVRLTKDPSPSTKIEDSTRDARRAKDDPDKVPTSHSEWQEQGNFAYYSRI